MDIDVKTLEVRNNRDENRFEIALLDDDFAFIRYLMPDEGVYKLIHTEVPEAYGGKGIAHKLVHDTMEMIKAEGAKIVPLCPFVRKYLSRHEEYQELVK